MQTSSFKLSVSFLFLVGVGSFGCGQAPDAGSDVAPQGEAGTSPSGWHAAKKAPLALAPREAATAAAAGAPADVEPATGAAAAAGAGGGATDDTGGAPGDAAGGSPIPVVSDRVPPRIVAVSPENGAVAVKSDARIVITFSEPMDRQATLDAFASETLPRAHTTPTWNEDGTVLTLVPDAPLQYAHATLTDDESLELEAKHYGYTLTRFATDLAGNPLPEASVTFSTLREVTHRLSPVPALTGVVQSSDAQPRSYGFLSFDAFELPSGILALERAVARSGEAYLIGDPVAVHDVEFDSLTADAIQAGPGTLIVTLPRGLSGDQLIPEGIASFLISDYLARSTAHRYSQFRFDLPPAITLREAPAVAQLLDRTSLEVEYLLP